MTSLDYLVLALFALALVRGLVRGLLREAFSIASLAMAVLVVRFFNAELAEWLVVRYQGDVSPEAAPWLVDYEQELTLFPNAAHDDRVDATSQFLRWIRTKTQGAGPRVRAL